MNSGSHKIVDPGQQHIDEPTYEAPSEVKNVLVVGASGYLGSALCLGLRDHFNVTGTYNKRVFRLEGVLTCEADALDATDLLNAVSKASPDIVIYCAGLTKLAACEAQYDMADALNSKIMSILFKVLPKPTPLIYLSCDHVLGNPPKIDPLKSQTPEGEEKEVDASELLAQSQQQFYFREPDKCKPLNALGETKLKGEKAVLSQPHLTWVLRLPLLYGESLGSPLAPRKSWLRLIQEQIENGETVELPGDQKRSSLYVGDLVRSMRKFLLDLPKSSGIYQISDNEAQSPFHIAKTYLEELKLDTSNLVNISLDDYLAKQKVYCEEAHNFPLRSDKFNNKYQFSSQKVSEGVKEMHQRLIEGYCGDWL